MKPCYKLKIDKIAELIKTQELKKYWVAEVAGVHKTTLRRWLKGQIQLVREPNLINLAKVLTTEPAYIADQIS